MTLADAVPASRGAALMASRRRRGEPRSYDFRRPTKLSRDHVRVLQNLLETFTRQTATNLTQALRTEVKMELGGIDQFAYDDYIAHLDNPVFMSVVTFEPLRGRGLMTWSMDIAMAMIDLLLGGSGAAEQPQRPMTGMETRLAKYPVERVLHELGTALRPIVRVDFGLEGFEYQPNLAQLAVSSETVVVCSFSLTLGERETEATLMLPFAPFAPALHGATSPQLSAHALRERQQAADALSDRLGAVPVEVNARFRPITVPSADLLSLAVGDVLLLRHPRDSPLEVTTNDVVFAHAVASNHRRRLAAEIVATPPGSTSTTRDAQ
ncbi:flagellar motor switch protein FliM [Klenkia marina]|nr:flagellar motor switch protein FliM [Klenkia marina]